jgi:hypothetical protein
VRERGYHVMHTSNHTNNPPMLKVNDRLGFEAKPQVVFVVKALAPSEAALVGEGAG